MVRLQLSRRLSVGLKRLYKEDSHRKKLLVAMPGNLSKTIHDRFYLQFGLKKGEIINYSNSLMQENLYKQEMSDLKVTARQHQSNIPVKQFYRRQLPDSCISFYSLEGQEIFKEALSAGYMQCYFRLAAQFRTQDEPAFCGLSTLVMVLNSLEVDPGKLWKGCWRWYHEEMLDCCEPLEDVKQRGINFDQFVCLAYCNYLKAKTVRGDENISEEVFRKTVQECTMKEDACIVASYSRRTLGQTGEGHFSPIAGYHPGKDLVLILDVARFKYPPHWVSLKLLLDAMKELDITTGKPRGYMLLSKIEGRLPLLVFRISSALAVTKEEQLSKEIKQCIQHWIGWLSESIVGNSKEFERTIVGDSIRRIIEILPALPDECCLLTTQIDVTCDGVSCEHVCAVCQLIKSIENIELYKIIKNNLPADIFKQKHTKIGSVAALPEKACNMQNCPQLNDLDSSHFIAVLLLSWPYGKESQTNGNALREYTNAIMENTTDLVKNEILNLRKQLATIFHLNSCCCDKNCQNL